MYSLMNNSDDGINRSIIALFEIHILLFEPKKVGEFMDIL